MQAICETYDILRRAAGLPTAAIQKNLFRTGRLPPRWAAFWSISRPSAWARSIPTRAMRLVEKVLDTAGQKGTGKWTAQSGPRLGHSDPDAGAGGQRAHPIGAQGGPRRSVENPPRPRPAGCAGDSGELTERLHDALYLSMIACYAQGLHLIQAASREYDFGTDLAEVARIWKDGCIIRSKLLEPDQGSVPQRPRHREHHRPPVVRARRQRRVAAVTLGRAGGGRKRRAGDVSGGRRWRISTATAPSSCRANPLAGAARQLRRAHLQAPGQGRRFSFAVEQERLSLSARFRGRFPP